MILTIAGHQRQAVRVVQLLQAARLAVAIFLALVWAAGMVMVWGCGDSFRVDSVGSEARLMVER